MPLQTTEAANLYLDRIHATAPGALVEWGMLNGDPGNGGVELSATDCPGYVRYVIADYAAFWPTAATGAVKTSAVFTPAAATDAWDDAAEWEGLWVDGVLWDAAPLAEAIAPSSAGPFQSVQISRTFGTT